MTPLVSQPRKWMFFLTTVLVSSLPAHARAEVVSLEILKREPFATGATFGDTGPYEKIVGIAHFAVDPSNARNKIIVDLDLAPRNAAKKVEFEADFCILMPKDPTRGNRAIFHEVTNRGNKLALRYFDYGPRDRTDPSTREDAGDGFLFRRGYTIVWCGWNGEVLAGGGRMLLQAPTAIENGKPVRGLIRQETVVDEPSEKAPLARKDGLGSYFPTKEGEANATLSWRKHPDDERVPIPRSQWSLEHVPNAEVKEGVPGTLPLVRLRVSGGLRPGYIYEMICEAQAPIVQGLGLAATRDLISYLRYDASEKNPLRSEGKPVIDRAHAWGLSQSGRFLRQFLYQGFNVDESGHKVFDGLMPHVAGGSFGCFNQRFGQPSRHSRQFEDHLFPTDIFPFTYGDSTLAYLRNGDGKVENSSRTDGILRLTASEGARLLPKVLHTQNASEYWQRSGSLVHTDPLGKKDADIPENVRIYTFGGTQHAPSVEPPSRGMCDNLHNPSDDRPFLRALLDALDAWVKDGTPPPPSIYPRIDLGTLVDWRQKSTGFAALPGVRYPEVIQQPSVCDYGPDYKTHGIVSNEPPKVLGRHVVLVPKSDADGNDMGTLLPVEVTTPLATCTGWNLRRREAGAEGMMSNLFGSYIPFAKTAAERKATGDPRPSIEERYGSFAEYEKRFAVVCTDLVKKRYLIKEDADRLIADRKKVMSVFSRPGE